VKRLLGLLYLIFVIEFEFFFLIYYIILFSYLYFNFTNFFNFFYNRLSHPSQKSTIPEPEQFRFTSEESAAYTNIADITFFEIVEEFAQDQNLLFLPTNKTHVSGKPLYRMGGTPEGVGGLLMFLSDDVMYVKEDQNWTPMGFEEVLEKLVFFNGSKSEAGF